MHAIITLVTTCCGTILLLSPTLFAHAAQPDFFIWAQLVGGGMCSSGVGMAFFIITRANPGGHEIAG